MGHIRLGRLPKSQRWHEVIALLEGATPDPERVAMATAFAAHAQFGHLQGDPSLSYCFWLLARLASAARHPDFIDGLGLLGLDARPADSAIGFIAHISEHVRDEVERHPDSGLFGEMASLSLRRALTETIGTQGRSLFGSSVDDIEDAFRTHATPSRFGTLARRFFGDFLARTLRFYVDKELLLHVGPTAGLADLGQADAFVADLDRHARQSARIVEEFASDWFSKHDWETSGAIDRDEAQGFVAVALDKLRGELVEAGA